MRASKKYFILILCCIIYTLIPTLTIAFSYGNVYPEYIVGNSELAVMFMFSIVPVVVGIFLGIEYGKSWYG